MIDVGGIDNSRALATEIEKGNRASLKREGLIGAYANVFEIEPVATVSSGVVNRRAASSIRDTPCLTEKEVVIAADALVPVGAGLHIAAGATSPAG